MPEPLHPEQNRPAGRGTYAGEKETLRRVLLSTLSSMDRSHRQSAGKDAMRSLAEQSFWKECRSLLVYLAFGPELDTGGVVRSALELGIEVFSPCIRGDVMEFRRIGGLDDATGKGVLGIREPGENAAVWSLSEAPSPSLVLTPGLAFDTRGGRLGRGRGYYDRFIRRVREKAGTAGVAGPLFIGYAYSGQIVPEVPVDGNDERLDGLVTDGFTGLF